MTLTVIVDTVVISVAKFIIGIFTCMWFVSFLAGCIWRSGEAFIRDIFTPVVRVVWDSLVNAIIEILES